MANVKASSNGSGIFSAQHASKAHLLQGPGGLAAEVQDVRLDLASSLAPELGTTIDEWDGPGAAAVLVLTMIPKLRMGAALVKSEILDGVAISPVTGTLTQPGGAGTPWQYNPATAVNASTAAVVTGSADLSVATLYGAASTLNGLTLILTVNGKPATLTFLDPVNPVNPPYVSETVLNPPRTILDVINEAFPGLTATVNGSHFLVLTDSLKGSTQSIVVGAGTANTLLGLTAATTAGTGHSYAITYEYDATLVKSAFSAPSGPVGGPPYTNNFQGP